MLPREIITRSWRPASGKLALPPTQRLLCVLSNGKILSNMINNNNSNSKTMMKFSSSSSSSSMNLKLAKNFPVPVAALPQSNRDKKMNNSTASATTIILRAAPCHSEDAVIQQTQQHIDSSRPVVPVLDTPTPLLDETQKPNQNEEKSAGTGVPLRFGKRKFNPWQKRNGPKHYAHSRAMSLEFQRARRGPATPTFPDGAPITRIRKFKHMAAATGTNVKFRKHKIYNSLKRGR